MIRVRQAVQVVERKHADYNFFPEYILNVSKSFAKRWKCRFYRTEQPTKYEYNTRTLFRTSWRRQRKCGFIRGETGLSETDLLGRLTGRRVANARAVVQLSFGSHTTFARWVSALRVVIVDRARGSTASDKKDFISTSHFSRPVLVSSFSDFLTS